MAICVIAAPPEVAANSFVPAELEDKLTVRGVLLTLP